MIARAKGVGGMIRPFFGQPRNGKAKPMPHNDSGTPLPPNHPDVLLWDMAGTLIPYDSVTGRPGVQPGCGEYLPELRKEFRLFVTTGDTCGGARSLLDGFELLDHFEGVYGDLFAPVGKPYGAILRAVGGDPERSLAVGDRLRADVAADTPDVVTVLINQDAQIHNCAMIAFLIHLLRRKAPSFPAAFDTLFAGGEPDPAAIGEAQGGEVTEAVRRSDGLAYRMWRFRHTLLEGERRVVVI